MANNLIDILQMQFSRVSFPVGDDMVVKMDDIRTILLDVINPQDVVSKQKIKSLLEGVLQQNYKGMLDALWKEIDSQIGI